MPKLSFTPEQCGLIAKSVELHAEQLAGDDAALEVVLKLSLIQMEVRFALEQMLALDRRALEQERRA